MGHDVLVDVGLMCRISPLGSEGRASRTVITMKVSMPWWGAIVVFRLLGDIRKLTVSCMSPKSEVTQLLLQGTMLSSIQWKSYSQECHDDIIVVAAKIMMSSCTLVKTLME